MSWFTFTWQNFLYSFLALAFEGLPFVLVGSLISGAIAAFVPSRVITGILPKNGFLATLASGLLGICFPVCECGIVPVIRRLLNKGLPVSCGVTFMLASPIVNPIVAFSTFAAFRGQDPWLTMAVRLALGYLVAVSAGLVVGQLDPASILRVGAVKIPAAKRLAFRVSPLPDDDCFRGFFSREADRCGSNGVRRLYRYRDLFHDRCGGGRHLQYRRGPTDYSPAVASADALHILHDGYRHGPHALQHLRRLYCRDVRQLSDLCPDGLHGLRADV